MNRQRITTGMVIRAAWEHYADLYAEGVTIAEISRRSGKSPSTVTDRMKKAGVFQPGRKGGAPKQARCQRDHDMEKHGKWINKDRPEKGRYCDLCRQMREGWGTITVKED